MATKPKTSKSTAPSASKSFTAFTSEMPPQLETLFTTARTVTSDQIRAGLDLTTANMNKVSTTMINNMNSTTGLNTEMMESTTQFWQTWAKGCEEIAKSYTSCMQSMWQDYTSTLQSMTTAKSVQDAVSVQSDFVRQQFDKVMSETTKISEMCVKVASDAAEPIQSQFSSMANKYSKAA